MKEDTKDILEELEKELLAIEEEKEITEEDLIQEVLPEEDLMEEVLPEPAFEDPDFIGDPEEPGVYRNFSNGYGQDLPEEKKNTMSRSDKINVGLMIANSALCLGIIGLLIYWLVAFL